MLLFAEKVTGDIPILAVPHRFWTFSIPKAIRGIMLRDRRPLKLILRCAFEALKQAVKQVLPRDSAASMACGAIHPGRSAGPCLLSHVALHGKACGGALKNDFRSEKREGHLQSELQRHAGDRSDRGRSSRVRGQGLDACSGQKHAKGDRVRRLLESCSWRKEKASPR